MKTLRFPKISFFLITFFIFSCKENKQDKIQDIFTGDISKKWYCYSIDENHSFYPYRVKEFFKDGRQIQYINNYTTKNLDTIPKDNMYNPEKWFVINDSVVSIESVFNPVTKNYYKENRKVLFYNNDTIILQGIKKDNYEGILLLTRYKDKKKSNNK